eukprot:GFUD01013602.1.p1 GENE.GFUD01013602.1~~GFUD01013602.1.p1  ORF type:complete len:380 (-),score=88.48 GFUD01013602.1:39-1178(-)
MMLDTKFYTLVVDKSFCQEFRARLGDGNIFDKKRKLLIKDDLAELPIVTKPDETLEKELKDICSFQIKSDCVAELKGKSSIKESLLSKVEEISDFPLDEKLLQEIPDSWEFYGDLLLLPGNSFSDAKWCPKLPQILQAICSMFKVKRVARKHLVINDKFRSPRTDLLLGSDPWVFRKENGITYHFDITKCMFSAGNISEKLRVSKFDCSGETVVDLFAGIGYFTLPYLVHAKAEYMYACEWNPDSVVALQINLEKLGLSDRCSVLEGDNRLVCPKNVADRVNLGLIPGSDISWRTACEALKDSGGILHIHGNVESKKEENKQEKMKVWAEATSETIKNLLNEVKSNQSWDCQILHIECVKSYAPRVYHLVLDLECKHSS